MPTVTFDRALCLDVLEHLTFEEQPRALAELFRVLKPGGELLVSIPNLAHLQSRDPFPSAGPSDPDCVRTRNILAIGRRLITSRWHAAPVSRSRPARNLSDRAGPDAADPPPPRSLQPLHRWLTRLLPIPGWCFLNLLTFRKP